MRMHKHPGSFIIHYEIHAMLQAALKDTALERGSFAINRCWQQTGRSDTPGVALADNPPASGSHRLCGNTINIHRKACVSLHNPHVEAVPAMLALYFPSLI